MLKMERCRSGRTGRSRKPLTAFAVQGFESLSLRQNLESWIVWLCFQGFFLFTTSPYPFLGFLITKNQCKYIFSKNVANSNKNAKNYIVYISVKQYDGIKSMHKVKNEYLKYFSMWEKKRTFAIWFKRDRKQT